MWAVREFEMPFIGALEMPKPGYVAPSRTGKVPLTVYVDMQTRQGLKIAAAVHAITIDAIMQEAIAIALKKYPVKTQRLRPCKA